MPWGVGDGRESRGNAGDGRRGFAVLQGRLCRCAAAARSKWGALRRLLREFESDAHTLVVAEERRDHGEVGITHLAEEGGGGAEESQEFVGLEKEGDAVAVASDLGLEVEESAYELKV